MTRTLPVVASLALGAAVLLPAVTSAASPAAASWEGPSLGTVDPDPCVGTYGLSSCERDGGMAVVGGDGIVVYLDDATVKFSQSADSGNSWGAAQDLFGGAPFINQIGFAGLGSDVAVGYARPGATPAIGYVRSFDFGDSWSTPKGFAAPRQLVTDTAIAIGNVTALVASGYDEIPQGRPGAAVRIKVFPATGTPRTRTFAFAGTGCGPAGADPSVAVTGNGTVVLAYWQTCGKLVVRRSTDKGATWSAPATLSTATHKLGMAIAAKGKTVVLAYTAGGKTLVRRSTNNGGSWGAPVQAGTGATSLRLATQGGRWHLLAAGAVNVVYRSSVNATSWTKSVVTSEADSRTFALGVASDGRPQAFYAIRHPNKVHDQYVANFQ